jgi:hypothetical protein
MLAILALSHKVLRVGLTCLQPTAKDTTVYLDSLHVIRALETVCESHNIDSGNAKARAMYVLFGDATSQPER